MPYRNFPSRFLPFRYQNAIDMENKILLTTDNGERVQAVAPVIISASRSTDIPAFYARWFFNRLERGYCVWYNPFNRQKVYVSFQRCRAVVFWTKNPRPILPYLHQLDERGIHYYFQVTLNDYEAEGLEPNVPPLEQRIETFRRLSDQVGHERVIWRFDPLMLTPALSPRELLERIAHIGQALKHCMDKLVFSFVDVKAYRKVQNNLMKEGFSREDVERAEMDAAQRTEIVKGLVKLREAWADDGWRVTLATCAEAVDLERYGIEHNRCIDGELMKRVFADDEDFAFYLNTGQWPERDMFGLAAPRKIKDAAGMKDKGQRNLCGCMVSKDIGMYDTCRHFCAYCYANTSRECVMRHAKRHMEWSESLVD